MAQAKAIPAPALDMARIIHIIIGLVIMFLFPYIGSPEFVVSHADKLVELGFPVVDGGVKVYFSDIGMQVICIFFGVIYLWTTVDTVWPGFLGIFALGMSSFGTMDQVLGMYFGSSMIIFMFTIMMYAGILIKSQVSVYLARYLMTRDFVIGRPWMLTTMLLVTTYIVAVIDQITSVFIMWPVMYSVFKESGYKKGDTYVSFMIIGVVYMALMMFATDAMKGGVFMLILVANQLAQNPVYGIEPIQLGNYLVFAITVSAVSLLTLVALMRFVFRVDVEALRNFDIEMLKANPLPPMDWKQKTTVGLFILLAVWLLSAGIIPPTNPVGAFLNQNKMGLGIFIVFLMTSIQYKGESFTSLQTIMSLAPWNVFFLIIAAMLFGSALTHPSTNFAVLVEYLLRDFFQGFSYFALITCSIIMAICITNFTNSVVAGVIFAPILIPLCVGYGYAPLPLLVCFFYAVLIALCTPAASPYAALLFGNSEWISTADAAKYALIVSSITIAVLLVVGVPLASILF